MFIWSCAFRCVDYKSLLQLYLSLQRSYAVKAVRTRLYSEVDVVRDDNGAYWPFKETLSSCLSHLVSCSTIEWEISLDPIFVGFQSLKINSMIT